MLAIHFGRLILTQGERGAESIEVTEEQVSARLVEAKEQWQQAMDQELKQSEKS